MDDLISSTIVSDFLLACKEDVLKVRDLFRERKYRRCAVLCSRALREAAHPLHRTFLYFYQAVCYENLGHISHNYSSNKIPLLEQARDSFISANDLLPLPFLTKIDGEYDEPRPSPLYATSDLLDFYYDSPSIYPENTPFHSTERRGRSLTKSTPDRGLEDVSVIYTIPDFDQDLPRMPLSELSSNRCIEKLQTLTPRSATSNHKARLSASLSSQHVLAEALVPSPLYSRAPSSKKETSTFIVSTDSPMPVLMLGKPLPPTPINRPLPSLPFNPYPSFMLKGKRIVIVPNRKTALSTLIQKFEGRGPCDASPAQLSAYGSTRMDSTPTTERFKRISAVFDTKNDHNKENEPPRTPFGATVVVSGKQFPPVTPCPKPHVQSSDRKHDISALEAQKPTHLELYNTHLSAFRSSLLTHISTVSKSITQTRTIQLEHEAEKRRNFAAMSSHIHKPSAIPAPSRSKSRGRSANRASQSSPIKDARLRSFWSLQAAEASERVETSGNGMDRKVKEQRERIERLRKNGWKDVRKEAKGFKGVEYYEELRRSVEEEMLAVRC